MATPYIMPDQVTSPKRYWVLVKVLLDTGEGGYSIALGRWENDPALGIRWNGTKDNPIGNPQSRGLPTWFIVPADLQDAILEKVQKKDMVQFALKFLE